MMKRLISLLLAITLMLNLTACNVSETTDSGSDNSEEVSMGNMLALIDDEFGMYSYQDEEPHTNVNSDSPYFGAVQSAYEWGVIDEKATEIDLDKKVTKQEAARMIANAAGADTSEVSDKDIVDYAVEKGYFTGDKDGKLTLDDAVASMAVAKDTWQNPRFGETETVKYNDKTADLSNINDFKVSDDGQYVSVPKDSVDTNKTYAVLPTIDSGETSNVYIVSDGVVSGDRIVFAAGGTQVDNIEDIYSELHTSGSKPVNFNNAVITDGAGNQYSSPTLTPTKADRVKPQAMFLNGSPKADAHMLANGGFNFEADGLKINGNFSGSSINFSASGKVGDIKVDKSYSVQDIKFDQDIDFNIFKGGLQKAYAQLKYKTVDTTKASFEYKGEWVKAPYNNGNGKFPSNFKNSVWKDADAKGAKTIKIVGVKFYDVGVVSLNLEIKLKVSLSGDITLTVTTNNTSGMEYKKGAGVRLIKESSKNTELDFNAKLEACVYIGLSVRVLAVKKNIFGMGFDIGIGAELTGKAYLVEPLKRKKLDEISFENGGSALKAISSAESDLKTTVETCADLQVYFILRFTTDPDCLVSNLTGGALSQEIFGKSNALIQPLCMHWEDGVKVPECTRDFNDDEEEKKEETAPEEITQGMELTVAAGSLVTDEGTTRKIAVLTIPKGYKTEDLRFESNDADVATVDGSGDVTANSGGVAMVTVSTSDGTHKQVVTVRVVGKNNEQSGSETSTTSAKDYIAHDRVGLAETTTETSYL